MTKTHSTLDRLEARIDYQAARIDELYRLLEARGTLPPERTPPPRPKRRRPPRRAATRLHVGNATGV